MPLVAAYHRPLDVSEALSLLSEPHRVPLAGGTTINADRAHDPVEVVDLQALGLNTIATHPGELRVGAMATLQSMIDSDAVPPALSEIARAASPSTLRTIATVGGTIASRDSSSVLLAALLVHNAEVTLANAGVVTLEDLLATGVPTHDLIMHVTFDPTGPTAVASTARTPADNPIVAAVARRGADQVALTGVANTPVLVDAVNPTVGLAPPPDFRGSTAYRLELARVLTPRAVEAVR